MFKIIYKIQAFKLRLIHYRLKNHEMDRIKYKFVQTLWQSNED